MPAKRTSAILTPFLILAGALLIFLATDRRLAFLEDETIDVSVARLPVSQILYRFVDGEERLEHPPLAELLLHFWLPVAGGNPRLLRLPAMLLYLSGLFLYAVAARKIAGTRAFYAMLCIGSLWPFGLHFGRLIGWYCLSFFLVAALTLAYLRYLDQPGLRRWWLVLLASALLICSNYYGWAIVACLIADAWFAGARVRPARFTFLTLGCLALAYIPVWTAFRDEAARGFGSDGHVYSRAIQFVYCFYSLFVSESVAPWFWVFSVPVAAAIAVLVVSLVKTSAGINSRFLIYFFLLYIGMGVLGILTTKRLLFISGWLLFPLAVQISPVTRQPWRAAMTASLAFVVAIGWMGFASERYYAAPHFIEPWPQVAENAAGVIKNGGMVLSNSPAFMFYLHYALGRPGVPGYADDPRVAGIDRWEQSMPRRRSTLLFVKGVNINFTEDTARAQNWLQSRCTRISDAELLPDSGYSLKARMFPDAGQMPFRISVQTYVCNAL